jgi:hypothetical protein
VCGMTDPFGWPINGNANRWKIKKGPIQHPMRERATGIGLERGEVRGQLHTGQSIVAEVSQ